MNETRACKVGRDDDYGSGWLITIAIVIFVVAIICAIIFYGGIFIGGFHSLKNYFLSLKKNVFKANFGKKQPAT